MQPERIFYEDWRRPGDNALMDTMIFRVPGGIILEMYANGDRCFHAFSQRPDGLGQACDGTIESCVLALFYDYCEAKGFHPAALYRDAYPERDQATVAERQATMRRAMAEGVCFPQVWDAEAFNGLIESLEEINFRSLASALEEEAGS